MGELIRLQPHRPPQSPTYKLNRWAAARVARLLELADDAGHAGLFSVRDAIVDEARAVAEAA